MRTLLEFRVESDFAERVFGAHEGKDLGSIRVVRLQSDDPRVTQIGAIQSELRDQLGRCFFYGWRIIRQYSSHEWASCKAVSIHAQRTFEPPGELCGTEYDENQACSVCGAGAPQVSTLRLDLRKVPKRSDFGRSIAGEVIVSQRMAETLVDTKMRGFELIRVRHKARYEDDPFLLEDTSAGRTVLRAATEAGVPHSGWEFQVWMNRAEHRPLVDRALVEATSMKRNDARWFSQRPPSWYQVLPASTVRTVPPTTTGVDPFDNDLKNEHRCPRGDTIGLNLLSELSVSASDFEKRDSDILHTAEYIGSRVGLLRPERQLIISARLFRLLRERGIKGYRAEIVHLV